MGGETGALPFLISLVKRPQYCYLDSNGHPQTTWRAFTSRAATDPTARERSGWRLPARSQQAQRMIDALTVRPLPGPFDPYEPSTDDAVLIHRASERAAAYSAAHQAASPCRYDARPRRRRFSAASLPPPTCSTATNRTARPPTAACTKPSRTSTAPPSGRITASRPLSKPSVKGGAKLDHRGGVTRPEGGGKPDRSRGPPSIPRVCCGTQEGCIEWTSMRRCGAACMWRD